MSKNLNIPSWYHDDPDEWEDQTHRPKAQHIERFALGLGFKLESAHKAWGRDALFSIFFNIQAKTIPGHYDIIRTYVYLVTEDEIRWNIQIPKTGQAMTLAEGTDSIKADKYKAALMDVLRQYKVYKAEKAEKTVDIHDQEVEQIALF